MILRAGDQPALLFLRTDDKTSGPEAPPAGRVGMAEAVFPVDAGKVAGIARETGGEVELVQFLMKFCEKGRRSDLLQGVLFQRPQGEVVPEA